MFFNGKVTMLILLFYIKVIDSVNKFYKIERMGECADTEENVIVSFKNVTGSYGKSGLKFRGSVTARESVDEDLTLRIEAQRCDLNGMGCRLYSNVTVPNVCGMITNNLLFGDKISKVALPPFKCNPLKAKTFVIQDIGLDLSPLNVMPIENHRWIAKFIFTKSSNLAKIVGCFSGEASVMPASSRSRGRG